MNGVSMLWSGIAGAALTLSAVHGLLWLQNRRGLANLAFCIVAISAAGIAVTELGMMHAASAAEYGDWVRWFHLPNFFAILGLVAFVRLQFGGRTWLAGTIVALRSILVVVNFSVEPNVNWSSIASLRHIEFLGESVAVVGGAEVRPIQWIATLANLLFIAYVADALVRAWRAGGPPARRKTVVVCGGILAFILVAILEAQLVVWQVVRMPVVVAPPFLFLMAAIAYELTRDIVASARAEREAHRLRDEAAHVARINTLSQLSGSLAHELNQPLAAILLNAQAAGKLLQAEKPDLAELREIVADIADDDRRAAAIIERMRAMLRGKSLEFQAVSLPGLVRDVIALVHGDAARRRVTLEAALPEDLPPVRGDRVQLSQVLLNLLVNAMDSLDRAPGGKRRVRIFGRVRDDRTVEVGVADSGGGIPAEVLPRVFDAFVTTKPSGLGIGLAVSRAIMEAHGGELSAQNNPRGGATFSLTLPVAAA